MHKRSNVVTVVACWPAYFAHVHQCGCIRNLDICSFLRRLYLCCLRCMAFHVWRKNAVILLSGNVYAGCRPRRACCSNDWNELLCNLSNLWLDFVKHLIIRRNWWKNKNPFCSVIYALFSKLSIFLRKSHYIITMTTDNGIDIIYLFIFHS